MSKLVTTETGMPPEGGTTGYKSRLLRAYGTGVSMGEWLYGV